MTEALKANLDTMEHLLHHDGSIGYFQDATKDTACHNENGRSHVFQLRPSAAK